MKKVYNAPEMLEMSLLFTDVTNNGEYDILSGLPGNGDNDESGADGGEEFQLMNKKTITIIAICIVLVVGAVVAVLVTGNNDFPITPGTDELVVDKDEDNAVIIDFDTGSVIQTPQSKPQGSSQSSDVQSKTQESSLSESTSSKVESGSEESTVESEFISSETSSVDPEKETMSGFTPWQ